MYLQDYATSRGHVELTQHVQIVSHQKNMFLKVWPFIIYPPPSEFTHPPSEKIGFEASGPFWTFFLKSQDPKNVDFDKHDVVDRKYEKIERP